MFDLATRQKIRFDTSVGLLSVEDLWDLPLQNLTSKKQPNLDDIAKNINRELKEVADEVSFVNPAQNTGNDRLKLAFAIVKHIITVKVEERGVAAEAQLRREKKQRLLELISHKENEQLAGKSLEELQEMVTAL